MLRDALIASLLWGIYPIFLAKSLPFLSVKLCCLVYTFINIIFYLYLRYIKHFKINLSNVKNITYANLFTVFVTLLFAIAFKNAQNKSYQFISIAYCIPILLSSLFIAWYKKIKINIQSYISISLIMVGLYTLINY